MQNISHMRDAKRKMQNINIASNTALYLFPPVGDFEYYAILKKNNAPYKNGALGE